MDDFYTDIKKYIDNDIFYKKESSQLEEKSFNSTDYINHYNDLYRDTDYDDMYLELVNQKELNNGFNINNYIDYLINE